MEDNNTSFIIGCIVGGILAFSTVLCLNNINNNTYKDGQIDAINGKIKYELVKQNDGSTEWEKIKSSR